MTFFLVAILVNVSLNRCIIWVERYTMLQYLLPKDMLLQRTWFRYCWKINKNQEPCDLFSNWVLQKKNSLGCNDPELPRQRDVPSRYEIGDKCIHHFDSSLKEYSRRTYYERYDKIIASIKTRLTQDDYQKYSHLQNVLLKAAKVQDYCSKLAFVTLYLQNLFSNKTKCSACFIESRSSRHGG